MADLLDKDFKTSKGRHGENQEKKCMNKTNISTKRKLKKKKIWT